MTAYREAGFDFAVITDHGTITPDPGVSGILYIPGEEVTSEGHINNLGAITEWNNPSGQIVIDGILSDGAIPIMNHPNFEIAPWTDLQLATLTGYLGIEIAGIQNGEDKWDTLLTNGRKIFGVATDDAHSLTDVGYTWIMVDSPSLTVSNILSAIRSGTFYSSTGPTLCVSREGNIVTATTGTSGTITFIGANGTTLKTVSNVATSSYTIVGTESYIRVKITRNSDYKKAWSNPIWI